MQISLIQHLKLYQEEVMPFCISISNTQHLFPYSWSLYMQNMQDSKHKKSESVVNLDQNGLICVAATLFYTHICQKAPFHNEYFIQKSKHK